jgi:hypothetical protein
MCRETPPIYIDICVFNAHTLRKKRQKKDGLLWLFLVAGGVGFLWVGLCFVVGKPLAARQCFLGWEPK